MTAQTYTTTDCQFEATTLSGVIQGVDLLLNEAPLGNSPAAKAAIALMREAVTQSAELARMLDCVPAPEPRRTPASGPVVDMGDALHRANLLQCLLSSAFEMDYQGHGNEVTGLLTMARDDIAELVSALDLPSTKGPGPISAMVQRWKTERAALIAYAAENDESDSEPGYSSRWDANEVLGAQIANAQPMCDADAAAMLDWAMIDSDNGNMSDATHHAARKGVADYLNGKAVSK